MEEKEEEEKVKRFTTILSMLVALVFTDVGDGVAEVPQQINFQGLLTDIDDGLLGGTYEVIFRIYPDKTVAYSLWAETTSVYVDNGVFTVLLGDSNPIPDTVFTSGAPRWLGVQVEGDSEMRPLLEITSVGYAFHSQWADTAVAAKCTTDGDWSFSDSGIYYDDGYVGIGTDSPSSALEVIGNIKLSDGGCIGNSLMFNASGICFDYSGYDIELMGADIGIGTRDPTSQLDVDGDVRVQGDLDVEGDVTVDGLLNGAGWIKLVDYYDSGWFSISPNGCVTKSHDLNLNLTSDLYCVFLYGKNDTNGNVHQANYGTNSPSSSCWWGCEWDNLTSTTVRACRGNGDGSASDEKQWDQARFIILKIQVQLPPVK